MNGLRQWKRICSGTGVYFVLLIICSFLTACCALDIGVKQSATVTTDLLFRVPDIKLPQFPNNNFRITDYGAVGDGHTKNTEAFARAIQACVEVGGGRVIVPAGL